MVSDGCIDQREIKDSTQRKKKSRATNVAVSIGVSKHPTGTSLPAARPPYTPLVQLRTTKCVVYFRVFSIYVAVGSGTRRLKSDTDSDSMGETNDEGR